MTLTNKQRRLIKIAKHFHSKGISVSMIYDFKESAFYLDLDTQAKSELHLYEDGTLKSRYHSKKIKLGDPLAKVEDILRIEFKNNALCGKSFGNPAWIKLISEESLWSKHQKNLYGLN